ncbi:hypothetical protein EDD18DRAFT_1455412 [Armillaria luteobubalina]|uniref:Fibronectin type-III domain-containing protein n=1 Tax=Armillaria luteobubalina TaxID=153913 RepID=A0AA39QPC7_9AGAR|nr:hypothetical protein EDD18DRAFT_1455412 [Armillaria luteobubalina]
MVARSGCLWKATFWSFASLWTHASAKFMDQFFFDYTPSSEPVAIPVTAQCETIHITWDRTSGATGPSPTAPYYLQIYTSAFVFPFVVEAGESPDWQVPFAPGTLYQICMFDKNGYTGGCQATYSMIANTTSTPSCSNVTFPLGPLDIDAEVANGPLSQYGWIDQCTDISVTPKNGTPPYTLTVAPALHPPYNLTFNEMQTVNWTVELSWASPFFISVVDADFNFWSYGPLHSGGGGTTACLAEGSTTTGGKRHVPIAATIGAGVGGLLVGLLVGLATALFFVKRRQHKKAEEQFMPLGVSSPLSLDAQYRPVPSTPLPLQMDTSYTGTPLHPPIGQSGSNYQVEPFSMPGEDPHSHRGATSPTSMNEYANNHAPSVAHESIAPSQAGSGGSRTQSGQVYVVHHDGGRAPVTVYHETGTEVVELPPRYAEDGARTSYDLQSEGPSGSGGSDVSPSTASRDYFNQPRRPGGAPKKPQASSSKGPP